MKAFKPPPPLILIVDDTPQNLQVAGEILAERLDCELSFATSGEAALDSIADLKPDLLLLDVVMPGMNGFEVCRRLKSDPVTAGIPVIFFTGQADPSDVVAGFEAGGDDYVTKPFHAAELLARVGARLQLKQGADLVARKNDDLRHLLQILCHDLANPIASINGLLELCEKDPSALAEFLPDLREVAQRAEDQIRVVREMHVLDDDTRHLAVMAFPLAEAVTAAQKGVSHRFREKEISVECTIPEGLEVQVEPVSFINTVLSNLLSNAAKFSFRGGSVTISAARKEQEWVRIDIGDSGTGIPIRRLPGLFLPNSASSTPGTEGETGTGFGMPLIKSFTEAYGGQVHVDSRHRNEHPHGHGTVVSLLVRGA